MKKYMKLAIDEACKAVKTGEIPVGAVIVYQNRLIAKSHNMVETLNDPTAHAEIMVIREASKLLNNWRLSECSMYVTLEPCIMCMGAILNARMSKLVYGVGDNKFGAVESNIDLARNSLYKNIKIYSGIEEDICSKLMKDFFREKRK
ncbi:MAG: nucleoside deaminase [Eubacteriaceae bacterium]